MNGLRIAVWLAGLTFLVSCGGAPRTHYFVLSTAAVSVDASGTGSIGVAPFRVAPPYDGDRIVYRFGEHGPEVGFYPYHLWAAPLSRMLPSKGFDTEYLDDVGPSLSVGVGLATRRLEAR